MPGETIDAFGVARAPYQDTDNIGIGYGSAPRTTFQGNLLELFNYVQRKQGTGQISLVTLVGNGNYSMSSTDTELVTTVALTSSPTWQLPRANTVPSGTRRRFVDLAGVCSLSGFQIAIAPNSTDKISGVNAPIFLADKYSHVILESDGATNWASVDYGPALMRQDNLAFLPSPTTARANLGLGNIATHNVSEFLLGANNLSDITNQAAARVNLGISATATVTYANIDPAAIATPSQLVSDTPSKLVGTDAIWTSQAPITIPFQQTSCPWDFNTFINGLFTIPSTTPTTPNITIVPSNMKLGQSGFVIIRNQVTSAGRTVAWPGIFNLVPSTATTTFMPVNSTNLFEYWVESLSLVRIRVTTGI
jgi:hypothetical protein